MRFIVPVNKRENKTFDASHFNEKRPYTFNDDFYKGMEVRWYLISEISTLSHPAAHEENDHAMKS